jgi:hypothetical protein
MKILKQVQSALQNLPWLKKEKKKNPEQHLVNANQQIQILLTDTAVPAANGILSF